MTKTITGDDGWTITELPHGDWRGIHEARGLRTRLKRATADRCGLDWVKHDIAIGRLQRLVGGEWIDRIDEKRGKG